MSIDCFFLFNCEVLNNLRMGKVRDKNFYSQNKGLIRINEPHLSNRN